MDLRKEKLQKNYLKKKCVLDRSYNNGKHDDKKDRAQLSKILICFETLLEISWINNVPGRTPVKFVLP